MSYYVFMMKMKGITSYIIRTQESEHTDHVGSYLPCA